MKNGTCTKCGSDAVYSSKPGGGILLANAREPGSALVFAGQPLVTPVPLETYLCVSCGYFEFYIADRAVMRNVEKNWQRVLVR